MNYFTNKINTAFNLINYYRCSLTRAAANSSFHSIANVKAGNRDGKILCEALWDHPHHWLRLAIFKNALSTVYGGSLVGIYEEDVSKPILESLRSLSLIAEESVPTNIPEKFDSLLEFSNYTNKLLKMVIRDPSIMINEITPDNFFLFLNKMDGKEHSILNTDPNNHYKKYVPQLFNLVVIKDKIAEWLWFVLTGALVISNSHSYIMSIKCKRSPAELQAKLDKRLSNPKKEKKNICLII